ncbi:MAG: ABC transporter permease, partial [Clostridia bacterium]|nr:ABC transporter permease [Clostridia bacterium]
MAKRLTPAMQVVIKQREKEIARNHGKEVRSTPAREAWKRLKRNKLAVAGMVIIAILLIIALIAPFIIPYDYTKADYDRLLEPPSKDHIMGTDQFGRDIFSRLLMGTRISLPIGVLCVLVAFAIGGVLGSIAAYYGGTIDNLIMRIMDIFQSIPSMLMAIAVAATLGNGLLNLVIALSVSSVPGRSRIVRAAMLTVKNSEYVESARSMGASPKRQLVRYMLPNCVGTILTQITFGIAASILTVSSLSYIELGIVKPTQERGTMLSSGKKLIRLT